MSEGKQRGDAEIDKIFSTPEERQIFYDVSEKRKLADTQAALAKSYQLDVSLNTISRWLTKVRRERYDARFFSLVEDIKSDAEKAEALAAEVGNANQLTGASITMLAQALFRARNAGDENAMKLFAKLLSTVIGSVAADKSATASVIAAVTQRSRFQFDAAKKALEHAAELQDIKKSTGSEREKVERAIDRLFGPKPKEVARETRE